MEQRKWYASTVLLMFMLGIASPAICSAQEEEEEDIQPRKEPTQIVRPGDVRGSLSTKTLNTLDATITHGAPVANPPPGVKGRGMIQEPK